MPVSNISTPQRELERLVREANIGAREKLNAIQKQLDTVCDCEWQLFTAGKRNIVTVSCAEANQRSCFNASSLIVTSRNRFDTDKLRAADGFELDRFYSALKKAVRDLTTHFQEAVLDGVKEMSVLTTAPQCDLRQEAYVLEFWLWQRWMYFLPLKEQPLESPEANARHAIKVLNELHQCDPDAIGMLSHYSVPCNEVLANHPTCQVSPAPKVDHAEQGLSKWRVRLVGVLNAIYGTMPGKTCGWIAAQEDDKGRLEKFVQYTPYKADE